MPAFEDVIVEVVPENDTPSTALQNVSEYLRSPVSPAEVSVPNSIKEILYVIQRIERLRDDLAAMDDVNVNLYQFNSAISNLRFVAGELVTLRS